MSSIRTFGRRAVTASRPPLIHKFRLHAAASQPEPEPSSSLVVRDTTPLATAAARSKLSVEQELEEWKEARKIHRRSFREPWRSVSIVAGLAFVATSWMLPEDVANVAQIPLAILTIGSILAGWRQKKPVPQS
jgi:hypothetical protein